MMSHVFIIEGGQASVEGFCICDIGSSERFANLKCISTLRKFFNSDDILDQSCRIDIFKTSSRYR